MDNFSLIIGLLTYSVIVLMGLMMIIHQTAYWCEWLEVKYIKNRKFIVILDMLPFLVGGSYGYLVFKFGKMLFFPSL